MTFYCKLTGNKGKPVKAHIIPKAFYNDVQEKGPALIVGNPNKAFPKKTLTGLWDPNLVTHDGEQIFSDLDDYGIKLLIKNPDTFDPWIVENKNVGLQKQSYDYKKFKLFLLSIAWRASESSLPQFKSVSLGPHSEIIKDMILSSDPKTEFEYSVNIFRFLDPVTKGAWLFPYREKFDGVNYYRFFLREYSVIIKMDRRNTPHPFNEFCISPLRPLFILDRTFKRSPEEKAIKEMLQRNDGKMPGWFLKEANK